MEENNILQNCLVTGGNGMIGKYIDFGIIIINYNAIIKNF